MSETLDKIISSFESRLDRQIGALETYTRDRLLLQDQIDSIELEISRPKGMHEIVGDALNQFRNDYTDKYSAEVSNNLEYVMEDTTKDVECKIKFSDDGKQMFIYMRLTFHGGKVIEGTPKDIQGGGYKDVMGVIFTLSYISQKQDMLTGPIWMDEPTKQLSVGSRSESFYKYIESYNNILENQIILMTHDRSIIQDAKFAHHTIEVKLDSDGSSHIHTMPLS